MAPIIYGIISQSDVSVKNMHNYLINKTGDDGGNIPELFHDLSLTESVNSVYAFATACVITNNFTKIPTSASQYETRELAILALIQYLKGMATTVQLRNKCVCIAYEKLKIMKALGTAPSLLNLDGDLFSHHFDSKKFYSKEAADMAEDSFPYWVINTYKEIKGSDNIMEKPQTNIDFKLPYYIQNTGDTEIVIIRNLNKKITDKSNIIGHVPVSGKIVITEIKNGFGKVHDLVNTSAWVQITDKTIPVSHYEYGDSMNDYHTKLYDDVKKYVEKNGSATIVATKDLIARWGDNEYFDEVNTFNTSAGSKISIDTVSMGYFGHTFKKSGNVCYFEANTETMTFENFDVIEKVVETPVVEEPAISFEVQEEVTPVVTNEPVKEEIREEVKPVEKEIPTVKEDIKETKAVEEIITKFDTPYVLAYKTKASTNSATGLKEMDSAIRILKAAKINPLGNMIVGNYGYVVICGINNAAEGNKAKKTLVARCGIKNTVICDSSIFE